MARKTKSDWLDELLAQLRELVGGGYLTEQEAVDAYVCAETQCNIAEIAETVVAFRDYP